MPLPTPLVGAAPYGKVLEIILSGQYTEGPSGGTEQIPTANVFHYRWNGAGAFAAPTKGQVYTAFAAGMQAAVAAALSARWTSRYTTIRFMDDAADAPTFSSPGLTGAIAGDCLPPRNAVYHELTTGIRGRNWLGAKHFSPIAESDTTGTELVTPTPAWWTALNTAMTATMTANGMVYNLQVLSTTLSQLTTNPVSIMSAPVTVSYMRRNLGQMKRRRPKLTTSA